MSYLAKIKKLILSLIDDMQENIFDGPIERGDLKLVHFFFSKMHENDIGHHVIKEVLPYADFIKRNDKGFFLKNTGIFSGLPKDRIEFYSKRAVNMPDEDVEVVFQYFNKIVKYIELYKKND